MDSLKQNLYYDSLAIIAYHWRTPLDTLTPEDVIKHRSELYDIQYQGRGEVFIDGSYHVIEENPQKFGEVYRQVIELQRGYAPPYDLSITYTLTQDQGTIHVSIFATDTPPADPQRLFLSIAEDSITLMGITYNYVARAMIPDTGGIPISLAYAESLDTSFAFVNNWDPERIAIIGFIQEMESRHILQTDIGEKKED